MFSPYIKEGVKCDGITIECLHAILTIMQCHMEEKQPFTITSISDGKHSKNSLHYKGRAVDIRTRTLMGITPQQMAARIKDDLGKDYDVVVEATHLHVEYDPK